ncbi:intracellular hyaluronan-binding protein 4.S-like isoform X2 [Tachypleus tridentatus]|uniref:intracellular hyaluronan-binding protein 4.S-like isoform X2 n=1 Tax=Tachypleus tridentatus TaxID=6853 RepID=UPI003FD34B1D
MENAYGIGVKNRYDIFLNEEEDPLEILKQHEEEKEKRKTDKVGKEPKGKGVKAGKQTSVISAPKKGGKEDTPNNAKSQEPQQKRTERPPPRIPGERARFGSQDEHKENEERKNKRNRDVPFTQADSKDRGDGEYGMRRGRGVGRGRGRGGRGRGLMIDARGKREFDRQSGSDKSGIKPVDKKEGGGAHNWGTVNDDLDLQYSSVKDEVPENDRSAEESTPETAELKEAEEEVTGEEGKTSVDEGPKEMTLDEWKRREEEVRSVPKFNLRKPGEGESQTQFGKKLYILKKKEEEDEDVEDEEDDEDEDEFSRRGRQKHIVDIEINFNDSRRGRGRGRGGVRGSGLRGSRGGGGGRGNYKAAKSSRPAAPKVDDLEAFPSLAAA